MPEQKWWQRKDNKILENQARESRAERSDHELLLQILHEIEEVERDVAEIKRILRQRKKAVSAVLFFEDSKGELSMDVTVHLNDSPLKAVQVEFDGPNGSGNSVPNIGPTSYTSSDPTVATVDPVSGFLKYLKAGVTTITGLNAGNGLTSSGVLSVISGLAQSAELQFVSQVPVAASAK